MDLGGEILKKLFVVRNYLDNFETGSEDLVRNSKKDTGIIKAYAES